MKKLILVLLALLLSVVAALWFREQGGYVFIQAGGWNLEMSLFVFVLATLLGVWLLWLAWHLLRGLWGAPSQVRGWWGERRRERARGELIRGMIRLAEGGAEDAEKLLLRDVARSDAPLLHYLAAAVAAQRRGSYADRDKYLAQADRTSRRARTAVGLLQAQLQIEARQWEQALASLSYLQERAPHNSRVLELLLRACEKLDDWRRVEQLLPELRKRRVLERPRLDALELDILRRRLRAATSEGAKSLDRSWAGASRGLREVPEAWLAYTHGLRMQQRDVEAERLLRAKLVRDWDERLLAEYGELNGEAVEPAYAQVEKWLKERSEDVGLLEAAGRLALRSKLWGRARDYLEAAASRRPTAATLRLLGELREAMGEPERAREAYYRALSLATGGVRPAELDELAGDTAPSLPQARP
ncbi:heme biosynthesis HemY N-terminal domain-containing protein [Alkalilimnicola sp. S0819]|uniref:heme biosynthesis HemY N-terminal domain-containing protein n=1 Tax=Alkalilimnicola sp. S0819 TaxID=2613922 RepID=UPI0012624FC0|nr:heme biosynthesis HemY N-terminal domain-containing protein [Alkalilimnicola sp. S0819]KAB7622681.1 heme biosynthesis protein HemY [Alkalilimnicola sp. S0819]MPQ17319.1 heme biosynthesis protein HemY [Alkalilimnicola sp. S0819]